MTEVASLGHHISIAFDDGDVGMFGNSRTASSPPKLQQQQQRNKHGDTAKKLQSCSRALSSSSSTSPSFSSRENTKTTPEDTANANERFLSSLVDDDDPVGQSLLRSFHARKNQTFSMRRVRRHQQKKRQIIAEAKTRFNQRKCAFSSMLKNDAVVLLKLLTRVLLIPTECRNLPTKPWQALRRRLPDEGFYPDIKQYVTYTKDIATTQRALNDAHLKLAFYQRLIDEEKRENEERGKSVDNAEQRSRSTNVDNAEDRPEFTGRAAGRSIPTANRKKN